MIALPVTDSVFFSFRFHMPSLMAILLEPPNGLRYPRVGGTRQRHFDGTSLKPRKTPETAQTPTRRVHAVLGGFSP